MVKQLSTESLKRFFNEILQILKEAESNAIEVWYEPSELKALTNLTELDIEELLENFEFLNSHKEKYTQFFSINKILFILEALKFVDLDIKQFSEILDFNGFETLIYEILLKNNYFAVKNFRFSDKSDFKSKTKQKRYEIDVIGLTKNFLIIIDAKQWRRKDSFSAINKAANLQLRRVQALKENSDIFTNLIHKLLGLRQNIKKRLPFILIPIMVTFEENFTRVNDNHIPLVSIYKLGSFLREFEKNLEYFKSVKIEKISVQKTLV